MISQRLLETLRGLPAPVRWNGNPPSNVGVIASPNGDISNQSHDITYVTLIPDVHGWHPILTGEGDPVLWKLSSDVPVFIDIQGTLHLENQTRLGPKIDYYVIQNSDASSAPLVLQLRDGRRLFGAIGDQAIFSALSPNGNFIEFMCDVGKPWKMHAFELAPFPIAPNNSVVMQQYNAKSACFAEGLQTLDATAKERQQEALLVATAALPPQILQLLRFHGTEYRIVEVSETWEDVLAIPLDLYQALNFSQGIGACIENTIYLREPYIGNVYVGDNNDYWGNNAMRQIGTRLKATMEKVDPAYMRSFNRILKRTLLDAFDQNEGMQNAYKSELPGLFNQMRS